MGDNLISVNNVSVNFDYQENEGKINEIRLAQDDLNSLENEWQNLEEEKLTKGL